MPSHTIVFNLVLEVRLEIITQQSLFTAAYLHDEAMIDAIRYLQPVEGECLPKVARCSWALMVVECGNETAKLIVSQRAKSESPITHPRGEGDCSRRRASFHSYAKHGSAEKAPAFRYNA